MTTKLMAMAMTRGMAKNRFILTNNNFQRASYFVLVSLPFLHHYNMKIPNFMSLLYEVGEHNTKIDTFFTLT